MLEQSERVQQGRGRCRHLDRRLCEPGRGRCKVVIVICEILNTRSSSGRARWQWHGLVVLTLATAQHLLRPHWHTLTFVSLDASMAQGHSQKRASFSASEYLH